MKIRYLLGAACFLEGITLIVLSYVFAQKPAGKDVADLHPGLFGAGFALAMLGMFLGPNASRAPVPIPAVRIARWALIICGPSAATVLIALGMYVWNVLAYVMVGNTFAWVVGDYIERILSPEDRPPPPS